MNHQQPNFTPKPILDIPPSPELGLVVVIPCYHEPEVLVSLKSLRNCTPPEVAVEVLVVVNHSRSDKLEIKQFNERSFNKITDWAKQNNRKDFRVFPIASFNLPPKHAGVGLARKIGMDEARRRLEAVGRPEGVILGFDADSRCDANYLVEVDRWFKTHPGMQSASLYFEHPLEGDSFPEEVYEAILHYELHLRYFIQAQHWAGHPHATHTIGSSMAVRARAYRQQGGMNRRQAGEDFYFLHKFTPLGVHGQITHTRVIPSPRPSERVPFGTGKDILEQINSNQNRKTYAPQTFIDLKVFFDLVEDFYQNKDFELTKSLEAFLGEINFKEKLLEIKSNTASFQAFEQRFFRWFNAFQIMKFAHFARDHFYPDVEVGQAAGWLLSELGIRSEELDLKQKLRLFRRLDRGEVSAGPDESPGHS